MLQWLNLQITLNSQEWARGKLRQGFLFHNDN